MIANKIKAKYLQIQMQSNRKLFKTKHNSNYNQNKLIKLINKKSLLSYN